MIKAILVFNNHGRPRLSKFYQYFVSKMKNRVDLAGKHNELSEN